MFVTPIYLFSYAAKVVDGEGQLLKTGRECHGGKYSLQKL